MAISHCLPRPKVRLFTPAAHRVKRVLHLAGATTCLLAIFISGGGHWAVLQSVAYTRMVVEFAQQDSFCTAVKKAFDERYACPLCPKIRDGYNKQHNAPPNLSEMHLPEFLVQSSESVFFTPQIAADIAFVSTWYIDISNAPPTPPPKVA